MFVAYTAIFSDTSSVKTVVAVVTAISPGAAEGLWCTINANFLTQVIGLAVSGAILASIPQKLLQLKGPDYEAPPWEGHSVQDAQKHVAQEAKVKSNRYRRVLAFAAGAFAYVACRSSFGVWIYVNLAVDGNTKCADVHGKFTSTTPDWVAALAALFVLGLAGHSLTWLASRGLPTLSTGEPS